MINFRTSANLVKVFVMAAVILTAAQVSAASENTESCEIVNGTGRTIVALECVALKNEWNNKDLLGGRVLDNGQSTRIKYSPRVRYFRLRIFFDNGKSITWKKIDFLDAWRLTLYQGSDGKFKYTKNSRG